MNFITDDGVSIPLNQLILPLAIETEYGFEILGTAFLYNPGGGFITAKHNFFDNDGRTLHKRILALDYRSKTEIYYRPIEKFYVFPEKRDVCVGMLGDDRVGNGVDLTNEIFTLDPRKLEVGERIITVAYPLNKVTKVDEANFTAMCRLEKHDGVITQHYPEGRDRSGLPYECYETSMKMDSGASGGPVFDSIGNVIGINSRGLESDGDSVSWITPIAEIMNIRIPELNNKTVWELGLEGYFKIL